MDLLTAASRLALIEVMVWTFSAFGLALCHSGGLEKVRAFLRPLWAELRPFYLPAAIVIFVYDIARHAGPLDIALDLMLIANWWFYKDIDEDDRWKRRRRKVSSTVKALASGRLIAAPSNS